MSYYKTTPFSGNVEKALEVAWNTFLPHGFTVTENTAESIELTGPGSLMAKGQDPAVGISKISISAAHNELSIKAEFGGINKTVKFMILLIVSLSVFFLVLFGILFNKEMPTARIVLLSLGPLIPWPIVIPLMAIWMKSRATKTLNALLTNITTLA